MCVIREISMQLENISYLSLFWKNSFWVYETAV